MADVKRVVTVLVKVLAVAEPKGMFNKKHYSFCLFTSITAESTKPLIELIKDIESNSVLDLYINSRGGFVPVAIGVFNFIKTIKDLEVNTYNVGHCDSAATLLFMLGKHRYVLKNSSFFMHSLQVNFTQPQTISSLTNEIKKLKLDTSYFKSLLVKNSNIKKKQWSSFMSDKGSLLKSKKSIEVGIANTILEKINLKEN